MSMSRGREEFCDRNEGNSFIDYTSEPPSLQNIVIVSIAVRLCTEPDINEDIKQCSLYVYDELEKRVLGKLAKLTLPDMLKLRVSNVIRPIGLQLLKPNYYFTEKDHCDFHDIFKIGGVISFTMEGTIDKVKSLKELINNDDQEKDFACLYELACKYCLEENVSDLWESISPERREVYIYSAYSTRYEYYIVDYWTAASLKNKFPNLLSEFKLYDNRGIYDFNHSICLKMTSWSVSMGNIFALKHFWQQLTEEEKNTNIENWIKEILCKKFWYYIEYQQCNSFADILFFLLSKLNDQSKQQRVFQTYAQLILKVLLFCWPWQKFFLPTIRLMFDYLPENVYVNTMSDITEEIKENRTTGELFRDVWHQSPLRLKNSFRPSIEGTLWNLLEVNDVRTIDVLISNASPEEKKKMAFNIINYNDFSDIILSGKFTFLDALINKLLPPDFEIERFKGRLIVEYRRVISTLILRNDILTVNAWLKWVFSSENEIRYFKKENINPFKIYTSLIRSNNYEFVNNFLNWYFETVENVTSFNRAFVGEGNFSRCFNLLIEMGDDHETGWDRFDKFVNYCLDTPEEVLQFKKLYQISVATFVKRDHLEFATKFLNWCLDSSDEISLYKNELLLSKKGIGMLLYRLNHTYFSWKSFEHTLKWFFPLSNETIDKLKTLKCSRFIGYKDYYFPEHKKKAFIYLLESLSTQYNTPVCASVTTDDTNAKSVMNILKGKDINADWDSDSSQNHDSDSSDIIIYDNYDFFLTC